MLSNLGAVLDAVRGARTQGETAAIVSSRIDRTVIALVVGALHADSLHLDAVLGPGLYASSRVPLSGPTGSTMTAAVLHGARDVRIETVPRPELRPGMALLRVGRVGMCGSDLHYFQHGGFGVVRKGIDVLLQAGDASCEELLQDNEALVEQALGPAYPEVDRAIRNYDYTAALRVLQV